MDSHDDETIDGMDEDEDGVDEEEEEDVSNNNNNSNQFTQRWTCDACGCNTNHVTSDRNCTICGTSSSNIQQPSNHFGVLIHPGTYTLFRC